MRLLLTGFEPYWDYYVNSSWVVAEKVATLGVSGVYIFTEQMPVSFSRVTGVLRKAIEKHSPDMIIMLGQASESEHIRLERVALNMMDARLSDNDNYTPNEEPINIEAPPALFTNTPIKSLCTAIERHGILVKISNSCGLYVCNRLYYEALMICRENAKMSAIFVHLPLYSATANKHTMPLENMVKSIQTIIEETYDKNRNVKKTSCACIRQ